jgi:translation initiation factor 1
MRLFEGTEFEIPPKCDRCGELEKDCQCPPLPNAQLPPEKQQLRIALEKRKKGKWVTVIRGLAEFNEHSTLLTQLKNHCGAGGTIKESTIEIQGDHQDRVTEKLRSLGFKLKK